MLDDPQYMTALPVGDGTQMNIVSRKCIRQLCCMFMAMFRVLHIVRNVSIEAEPTTEERALAIGMLKTHHVESSSDTFAFLQQIVQLSPGMRLVYRTNFAKMYNDISQVNPHYFDSYN